MATFGGYETVYELYRHGLGSVARAKPLGADGDEPEYVVKVFHPPHRIAGPEALKPAIDAFLRRARVQQDVATTAGVRCWAPIYEAAATRPGAYYVTRFYGRSAQKLIASRVRLPARTLYVFAHAVVRGLQELKHACGRSHGNLTPSNVLIGGEGPIDSAPIVLTDPAPAEQVAQGRAGEAQDLSALGEILYQLVLHRPFRAAQSYPLLASPEWSQLGRVGERWRELCNRLLDPNASEPITLDEVTRRLNKLRPKPAIVSPKLIAFVAVVGLVAGGAWAGVRYAEYRRQWRELCLATDGWFYSLQSDVRADLKADPEGVRTRLAQDAHLAQTLLLVPPDPSAFDPKRISGEEQFALSDLANRPPLSWSAYRRTPQALETLRTVERRLGAAEWPLLREIDAAERRYKERGWGRYERYLAKLVEDVRPRRPDVYPGIKRLLQAKPRLAEDLPEIESLWGRVAGASAVIKQKAGDDALLSQYDAFVRRYMDEECGAAGAAASLEPLRDHLRPLADLSGKLEAALNGGWPDEIDRDRLQREATAYQGVSGGSPDYQQFDRWVQEVPGFRRLRLGEESEEVTRPAGAVAEARKELEALKKSGAPSRAGSQVPEIEKELGLLEGKLGALKSRAWVEDDRRKLRIRQQSTDLVTAVGALRKRIEEEGMRATLDQVAWWKDITAAPAADSAAVQGYWRSWVAGLRVGEKPVGQALPAAAAAFQSLREGVEAMRGALRELDQKFPAAPANWGEPYAALAQGKREAALAAVLAAAPPPGSARALDSKALADARGREEAGYRAWCADAEALIGELAQVRGLLDNASTLADAPQVKAFREKLDGRPAGKEFKPLPEVAGTVARLDALLAVELKPAGPKLRQELAQIATAKESGPGPMLAAWRRLGALAQPAWPATAEELAAEARAREALKAALARLPDQFRSRKVSEELAAAGPVRLAAFLDRAAVSPDPSKGAGPERAAFDAAVKSAGEVADRFLPADPSQAAAPVGVRLAALPALAPETRYDLLLHALRQVAEAQGPDREPAALEREIDPVRQAVRALPAGVREQASVAQLLARLDALKQVEAQRGPRAPWQEVAGAPQNVRRFMLRRADQPGAAPVTLEFLLVPVAGSRPVYLSTTELSVGQFISLLSPVDWQINRAIFLWEHRLNEDPRSGPRTWDWIEPGISLESRVVNPGIQQSDYWLRDPKLLIPNYFVEDGKFNKRSLVAQFGGNPLNRPRLPMQYLPAHTALYVASLAGCRPPTSEEWRAAYGLTKPDAKWNLRDDTWARQKQHVLQKSGGLEWPDAGAFIPAATNPPVVVKTGRDALQAANYSDNTLFFREVDADDGQVLHNLVGNVAEYVFEDPRVLDGLPNPEKAVSYRDLLFDNGKEVGVIGGSALSGPEIAPARAWPVFVPSRQEAGKAPTPNGFTGFADVGLRLAFTASGGTPGERLRLAVAEAVYLSPGAAPAPAPAPPPPPGGGRAPGK